MYTLILTVLIFSSPPSTTMEHIPGFEDLASCIVAKRQWLDEQYILPNDVLIQAKAQCSKTKV